MEDVACRIEPTQPIAVLLVGIGGTGKSTTASQLARILEEHGQATELVRFDHLRKQLAPPGRDPFSRDPDVRKTIYTKAIVWFNHKLEQRVSLIIDSGLSTEDIRERIKCEVAGIRIAHIYCPLWLAIYRDTKRSVLRQPHERGWFLHLRAIRDRLIPFKQNRFPQPGITAPFDYPLCADIHVRTFRRSSRDVAMRIAEDLNLIRPFQPLATLTLPTWRHAGRGTPT